MECRHIPLCLQRVPGHPSDVLLQVLMTVTTQRIIIAVLHVRKLKFQECAACSTVSEKYTGVPERDGSTLAYLGYTITTEV